MVQPPPPPLLLLRLRDQQGLGNLDFLRHNPQFQQLRQGRPSMQPQMLEPILQQTWCGAIPSWPSLLPQNPEQFLSLLGEKRRGRRCAAPPTGAQAIAVTEEERDAIEAAVPSGL